MPRRNGRSDITGYVSAAPLSRLGDDKSTGIGKWFRKDERDFKECLTDWMLVLGCSPQKDTQTFLQKTGLEGIISAGDWQALVDEKKRPGIKLSNHLAVLMQEAGAVYGLPTTLVLLRRARAVAAKTELPEIELTDEQCQQLRAPLLNRIDTESRLGKGPDLSETDLAITQQIVNRIQEIHPAIEADEITERLAIIYRKTPKALFPIIREMVPEESLENLQHWADNELRPLFSGPGAFLRCLRQCKGLPRERLSEEIEAANLGQWEYGRQPINNKKLERLYNALRLSKKEMWNLCVLMNPELESGYIAKQLADNRIDYIAFPALNAAWLTKQPEYKQAGLLLRAFRERAGLTMHELAEKIGVTNKAGDVVHDQIGHWERSEAVIEGAKVVPLKAALDLNDEEYRRLVLARFPCFKEDWLSKQLPDKQCGMLLLALREYAGLEQAELGKNVGASFSTISRWELATDSIPHKFIDVITAEFKDNPFFTPELFVRAHEVSQKAIRERKNHGNAVAHLGQITQALEAAPDAGQGNLRLLENQSLWRHAGLIIWKLRERAGLSRADLGEKVGVSEETVRIWEEGGNRKIRAPGHRLAALHKALHPTDEEMLRLTKCLRPNLDDDFIRQQLHDKTPEYLSYPALHEGWLNAQDENKRAGLLLRNLREKAGLEAPEFAAAIGVIEKTLSVWELGHYPIDYRVLPKIHAALNPTNENMVRLTKLVQPTLDESDICELLAEKKIERLAFPALDPQWLADQPTNKQAGLLLRAFRERAGLTRLQLGGLLEPKCITQNLMHWEHEGFIPARYVPQLVAQFSKDPLFNPKLFELTCELSRLVRRDEGPGRG